MSLLFNILSRFVIGEGNGTPLQYFAWKIPWMEEPGRLQSMGLLRVGHDWATSLSLFTFTPWRRKWQPTPVFLPGESQGRGSLVAAVCGVTQSRTQLKWLSSSSRFVLAFLLQSKHLLISWLQSLSTVILELEKIKSTAVSIVYPSVCHEVLGLKAMILVFWMLSFKPDFSLSSLTFSKRLFSSSSLSALGWYQLHIALANSIQVKYSLELLMSPHRKSWLPLMNILLSCSYLNSKWKHISIRVGGNSKLAGRGLMWYGNNYLDYFPDREGNSNITYLLPCQCQLIFNFLLSKSWSISCSSVIYDGVDIFFCSDEGILLSPFHSLYIYGMYSVYGLYVYIIEM